MTTIVYTDGACLVNPGPGGWAWAVPAGPYASGSEPTSTNQRMEIRAVLEALRALDGPVHVRSDSTYVVNCFRDRWWEGWLQRGWLNKARKPVANRDLWEPLVELYLSRREDIGFEWVKGHADDGFNDLVDRLAVEAARTQTGRSGTGTPTDLGDPDLPLDHGKDPRLPPGHHIVVMGHRPPELGGYGDNPVAERIRSRLTEILEAKRLMHPEAVVLTGLGLGAEQLGARAAADAGIPYVAVLAYPGQESVWPPDSQQAFSELASGAERSILLDQRRPDSPQRFGASMARRDAWLGAQADEAVVVWDGRDPRLGRTVRTLQDRLGDDVWVLEPGE